MGNKNKKKTEQNDGLNLSTDSDEVEIIEHKMTDRELLINMSKKLENMQKQMTQVLMVVESQKKKIVEMENVIQKQKADSDELKVQLDISRELIDELQQRSRINNVIINGVKQEKHEDIYKIVETLGGKIGIVNPLSDVQIAHRVNSTNPGKIKPIVIRMTNSKARDQWTAAFRKSHLWKDKVYVNEHLTKKNQDLLFKTKQFKKANNYKYVWIKDCKILIRKDDQSRIFAIRNETDLNRMRLNPSLSSNGSEDYVSVTSSFGTNA